MSAPAEPEKKIEEVPEESQIPAGANVTIVPKHERQAKEKLLKLGLKPMKSISRVTFRKKGNFILAIEKPDVYKTQGGSYVVFGEAKAEDLNKRYAETVAAQKAAESAAKEGKKEGEKAEGEKPTPESITEDLKKASLEDAKKDKKEEEEEVDDKDVDTTGLKEDDIKLIMEQTNASKAKAVKALRDQSGDVVNAIIALTE